jgi:hypothetical protein
MTQEIGSRRVARARTVAWSIVLGALAGCTGNDAERAAEAARLATLEHEVRRLGGDIAALKSAAPAQHNNPAPEPPQSSTLSKAFRVACPQPWLLHTPLGATLWSCRAPLPTAEGLYPQCSVVFQPQVAIETKNYFEFALNAAPQLLAVKNLKDKSVKINGADGFEATFEVDPKPVPLKMMSALMPHLEVTYAVTCFAPSASFDKHAQAFRKIIDTFAFN